MLSDPAKRQPYDRFGHAGPARGGRARLLVDGLRRHLLDVPGHLRRAGGRVRRPQRSSDRGYDLETEVELTLEQVATGSDQTLEFERMDFCDTCAGSGAKPGTHPAKCPTCGGYGQVQQQVQGFFGVSSA